MASLVATMSDSTGECVKLYWALDCLSAYFYGTEHRIIQSKNDRKKNSIAITAPSG